MRKLKVTARKTDEDAEKETNERQYKTYMPQKNVWDNGGQLYILKTWEEENFIQNFEITSKWLL